MTPREEVMGIIKEREGHENVLVVPRVFIALTGDTDSALLLSQLLYWTGKSTTGDDWVYKSMALWQEELGLSRCRLETARRRLRNLEVLEESFHLAQNRRVLHLRLRRAVLLQMMEAFYSSKVDLSSTRRDSAGRSGEALRAETRETSVPTCKDAASQDVEPLHSQTPERLLSECLIATFRDTADQPSWKQEVRVPVVETQIETHAEVHSETQTENDDDTREEGNRSRVPDSMSSRSPDGATVVSDREPHGLAPEERRLFELLDRIGEAPWERDACRLRELLDDYPDVDHEKEFARFSEYSRGQELRMPWFVLRRWLDKARRVAPSPASGRTEGKADAPGGSRLSTAVRTKLYDAHVGPDGAWSFHWKSQDEAREGSGLTTRQGIRSIERRCTTVPSVDADCQYATKGG